MQSYGNYTHINYCTNKYITALCITVCYITIDTPIFDNVKKSAVELSGKKYKVRKNGGGR